MQYFDEARPRLSNGLPLHPWGQAIPEPNLNPLEAGGYEISLMLGSGTAHWHSYIVRDDDALLDWLRQWREDPEALILSCWPDFDPRPRRKAPKAVPGGKPTLSLDDII